MKAFKRLVRRRPDGDVLVETLPRLRAPSAPRDAKASAGYHLEQDVVPGMLPIRKFLTDTLAYAPATFVPAGVSFGGALVLTRLYSPGGYGIFALIMAIASPVIAGVSQPAAQAAGRFYADYEASGRLKDYSGTLLFSLLLSVVACLAASFLIFGLVFPRYYPLSGGQMLMAVTLFLVSEVTFAVLQPILPIRGLAGAYRRVNMSASLVGLGGTLGLVWLLGADPVWLILGPAFACLLCLPYLIVSSGLHCSRRDFLAAWKGPSFRRFWKYGAPMGAWFVASALLTAGDRFILQVDRGSATVGVYSLSYSLAMGAAALVCAPITVSAFPILMRQWVRREVAQAQMTLSAMTDISLVIGLGLLAGVTLFAQPVCSLMLDHSYHSGWSVLPVVFAGGLVWGISMLGHKGLEFAEKTRLLGMDAALAVVLNLALNVIFVPSYGVVASAWATLASYICYTALIWVQSRALFPWVILWKRAALALMTAAASYLIGMVIISRLTDSLTELSVGGPVFVVVFVGLSLSSRRLLLAPSIGKV